MNGCEKKSKFVVWIEKYAVPLQIIYEILVLGFPFLLSKEFWDSFVPSQIRHMYSPYVFWICLGGVFLLIIVRVI